MTEKMVTYEVEGDIAVIGLDRAKKRNAINDDLLKQLRDACFRATEETKAGVIFGHGDNFSAGLDLAEALTWMKPGSASPRRRRGRWHRPFDLIARGPIPFVAALKGACIGGGLELASACHIRVADETTFFALPEGQRGIFVGGGGSVRIARLVSVARMADMMLTGRVLSAEEAERCNFVQYLTGPGEALAKAKDLAARIAENPPLSNYAITNALPRMQDLSHDDALFMESLMAAFTQTTPDAGERLRAFLDKRAERLVAPPSTDKDDKA